MSDSHVNENEKLERELKGVLIINAGVAGTCVLFLSTMIAIPKADFDSDLNDATVAFAIALPFLAAAAVTYYMELLPGRIIPWTTPILSWIGWAVFIIGMSLVFSHINHNAYEIGNTIYTILNLSWIAFWVMAAIWILIKTMIASIKRRRARRKLRKPMRQPNIPPRSMLSEAARNGAQRPSFSRRVQRERKYHDGRVRQ